VQQILKQATVVTIGLPTGGTGTYLCSFNVVASLARNTLVNDNGNDQTSTHRVRDANGCLSPIHSKQLLYPFKPTSGFNVLQNPA
jgi:hypothetical protein